jgi:hypothetical protein
MTTVDEVDAAIGIADIEGVLQSFIAELEPADAPPAGPGRPRILPALCLWAGMLVCVVRGFSSQLAVWRLLSQEGLWYYPRFPVSDQAVYRRLSQDDGQSMAWLFGRITEVLIRRMEPVMARDLAAFAPEIVAIDETTLDPVQKKLPVLRAVPDGDRRLLPGKLAGIFDVRRQVWRALHYIADADQNEKVMARTLAGQITPGSLVLMDLGYFSFAWFDELSAAGLWWLSRLRQGTSYEVLHTCAQTADSFDGIIWLGKYRADRAKHAVRLVWYRQRGREHAYITNVRDPHQLSAADLVRLYARRWDIEMGVQLVKQHLNLGLLWSAKPAVILQQIWAVLIIAQILQALRFEIAQRAECDLFEVSMPLLIEYLPRWAAAGHDPMAMIIEHGRAMRLIRPSRRTLYDLSVLEHHRLIPLPAGIPLERPPRYAQRKCHRRGK